jgi:hypothetical protein
MAQWHLDSLRESLRARGWKIVGEHPGNDYDVSGTWEIRRSTKKSPLHIDFNGLDDLQVLPMPRAYGCHLREYAPVSLYFSKRRKWPLGSKIFISQLDEIDEEQSKLIC